MNHILTETLKRDSEITISQKGANRIFQPDHASHSWASFWLMSCGVNSHHMIHNYQNIFWGKSS